MSIFDFDTLNSLKYRMEEKFPALVNCYLEDGQSYVEEMQNQLPTGDLISLIEAAHSLKSASGLMGAMRVHDTASKLEYSGKFMLENEANDDFDSVDKLSPLYDEVYRAFAEARDVLASAY